MRREDRDLNPVAPPAAAGPVVHALTGASNHAPSRRSAGVWWGAVVTSASFATAGSFATVLHDAGWSPGATVTFRIAGGALLLLLPALVVLRGRWRTLLANARLLVGYGVFAVAGAQLCFFQALQYMDVGIALLVEFSAPLVIVVWQWLRHGQRPTALIGLGAVVSVAGLLLVIDLLGGAEGTAVHPTGLLWALGATVGVTAYFLLSADDADGLHPLVVATSGMVFASLVLGVAVATGVLAWSANTSPVLLAGHQTPWWVPAVGLFVVSAAIAYTTGIVVARELGPRLASFVAYAELVLAFVWAWALLGQLPGPGQMMGAVVLVVGIAIVKYGEDRRPVTTEGSGH